MQCRLATIPLWIQIVIMLIQASNQTPLSSPISRRMAKMALDALESEDVFVQRHAAVAAQPPPSGDRLQDFQNQNGAGRPRGQGASLGSGRYTPERYIPGGSSLEDLGDSHQRRGDSNSPVTLELFPVVHKRGKQRNRHGKRKHQGGSYSQLPPGGITWPIPGLETRNQDQYRRMRPSPSDSLPLEPLMSHFPLDHQTNTIPPLMELDTKKLKKLLGEGFNPEFMSVLEPREVMVRPNGSLDYSPGNKGFPVKDMDAELKSLTVRIPGRIKKLKIRGDRTKRRVLRFLSAYSYCPVQYQWKDMGARIWPRWLKEGSCYQGHSCSIPHGMTCQPEISTKISVLFWHCKRKQRCRWISIQYPIITSCKCAC